MFEAVIGEKFPEEGPLSEDQAIVVDLARNGSYEEPDDYPFSQTEVDSYWQSKVRKAPSDDGVTYDVLVILHENHSTVIRKLYNECLRLGYFPEVWKDGLLVLIPKKGNGVRPLTLLPELGRGLDSLLNRRLTYALQARN